MVAGMMMRPQCFACEVDMIISGDRWLCPQCGWWLPNASLCPICHSPLPEAEGSGGERICSLCGYELWPPRDDPSPQRRETIEYWYQPPGLPAYRVRAREVISLAGPINRHGGGGKKSGRKRKKRRKLARNIWLSSKWD